MPPGPVGRAGGIGGPNCSPPGRACGIGPSPGRPRPCGIGAVSGRPLDGIGGPNCSEPGRLFGIGAVPGRPPFGWPVLGFFLPGLACLRCCFLVVLLGFFLVEVLVLGASSSFRVPALRLNSRRCSAVGLALPPRMILANRLSLPSSSGMAPPWAKLAPPLPMRLILVGSSLVTCGTSAGASAGASAASSCGKK